MRSALHPYGPRCPPQGHVRRITAYGGPHRVLRSMALDTAPDPDRAIFGSHSMVIRTPFVGAVVHTMGVRTSPSSAIRIALETYTQLSRESPVAPIRVNRCSLEWSVLLPRVERAAPSSVACCSLEWSVLLPRVGRAAPSSGACCPLECDPLLPRWARTYPSMVIRSASMWDRDLPLWWRRYPKSEQRNSVDGSV